MLWIWVVVWVITRALMVVQVGFWNHVSGIQLQDVNVYESWSNHLAEYHMPTDEAWQYPPGAVFVMLLPRIGGAPFGQSFVVTMLLFDLAGLSLIALLARRTSRSVGVWVWLLALPLLQTFPILRFDLVPTVFMIAAMVVIQRRPALFGTLAGAGASIKAWPVVALFGEWERRRLVIATLAAAGAIALSFLAAGILFGNQSAFFDNQNVRGLEVEAVGDIPWYARQMITGKVPTTVPRNGTLEIDSGLANSVAVVLKWLGLLVLIVAALWWLGRERAIRRGRSDLESAAVSLDFIFAVALLEIAVSRVLSIQYMIWLVGFTAVVLTAGTKRMARPAWIAIGAIAMSAGLYQTPANMVIRNTALLVAALDAASAMWLVLRGTPDTLAVDARADRVETGEQLPEKQPGGT